MTTLTCTICLDPVIVTNVTNATNVAGDTNNTKDTNQSKSRHLLSCPNCAICGLCYQELNRQPNKSIYDLNVMCQCHQPKPVIIQTVETIDWTKLPKGLAFHRADSLIQAQETQRTITRLTSHLKGAIFNIRARERTALTRTIKRLQTAVAYLSAQQRSRRAKELVAELVEINTAAVKNMTLAMTDLEQLAKVYQSIIQAYDTTNFVSTAALTWYYQTDFISFTEATLRRARKTWEDHRYHYDIFVYREISPVAWDQIGRVDLDSNSKTERGLSYRSDNSDVQLIETHSDRRVNRHQRYPKQPRSDEIIHTDLFYPAVARDSPYSDYNAVHLYRHRLVYTECRFQPDLNSGGIGPRHHRTVTSYTWPQLDWISIENWRHWGDYGNLREKHGWCFYNSRHHPEAETMSGWYHGDTKMAAELLE